MPGWERGLLLVMVVLGVPCALALWIDFVLGPLRRFVWRRALGSRPGLARRRIRSAAPAPPRDVGPRGGERS